MKKIFIPLCCLFLLVFVLSTGASAFQLITGQLPAAAGGCSTAIDSCSGSQDYDFASGDVAGRQWIASSFVADGNSDGICRVDANLKEVGTYTGSLYLSVWSNTGTVPNAQLGTESDAIVAADIAASYGMVTFENFDSGSLTNGTRYHIVIRNTTADASNYVHWASENTDCDGDTPQLSNSSDGVSWGDFSYSWSGEFDAYE